MEVEQSHIVDQAIDWHLRLADADEHGWADFIAWLEASTVNAAAYDAIAMGDRMVGQGGFPAPAAVAGNDDVLARRRWPWLAAGMAAAALAAAFLTPRLISRRSSPYLVTTVAGERRTIALGDGTSIEMSGGTALRLDRTDPRVAALERGEALFRVRHDGAHPFTVTVDGLTIHDLGTVFNVASDRDGLTVAVSDGSVLFQTGRDARKLGAGDALAVRGKGQVLVATRVAPALVGGWRTGRLSFDNQEVSDVAAALERLYGFKLELGDNLSRRPFTGMVHFTGIADQDIPHLAEMVGATWRRDGKRWILSGGGSGSR